MADESHYETLGIRPMADTDAIKRAYRDKIRQHHPDNFAGERSRLQRDGKLVELQALERRIAEAERMTQRINRAYAVLSDPVQRSNYDRVHGHRSPTGTVSSAYTSSSSYSRPSGATRTTSTRSSSTASRQAGFQQPPPAEKQTTKIPWPWFVGLMILVSLGAIMVNNFLDTGDRQPTTISAGPSARDLQSTESARQSTRVARTQAIAIATATPQSPDDYLASADAFLELGYYELALEGYSAAFDSFRDDPIFYLKRGMAYAGLADGEAGDAADAALVNFRRALFLEPDNSQVYRERGLLYYALWQTTDDSAYAQQALLDLNQLSNPDTEVETALTQLAVD